MKHRGPSSSLNPARETARAQERARVPVVSAPAIPASSALVGAANPVAKAVDGWEFGTDQDGNLTAAYAGGTPKVIATRDDQDNDEEEGTQ